MADKVTEREKVIIEKDTDDADRGMNPIGGIVVAILIFILLAFLFGWFGLGADNTDETNPPIEQETQVEVPNPVDDSPRAGDNESPGDTDRTQ